MSELPTFVVRCYRCGEVLDVIKPEDVQDPTRWWEATCWGYLVNEQHQREVHPNPA